MRRIALRGWRHLVVLLVMLLVLSMLIRNLFAMQVLQADSTLMEHRYREEVVVAAGRQPVRGTIVDANGMTLVDTITVYKIGALPKLIAPHDRARVAKAVATILFPIPSHRRCRGACRLCKRVPGGAGAALALRTLYLPGRRR